MYIIQVILNQEYNQEIIKNILLRGAQENFIYYNQDIYENYGDFPIINIEEATNKVMQDLIDEVDGGPRIYAKIKAGYAFLTFYKSDNNLLELHFHSFDSERKKIECDYHGIDIDWPYYIRLTLILCQDYGIVSFNTERI